MTGIMLTEPDAKMDIFTYREQNSSPRWDDGEPRLNGASQDRELNVDFIDRNELSSQTDFSNKDSSDCRSEANETTWRDLARIMDPYLSICDVTIMRQTCKYLYRRKYRPYQAEISFQEARGQIINFDILANVINKAISTTARQSLRLNFDGVYHFRNSSLAKILSAIKMNLEEISFSNCQQVTNESIGLLCSIPQPNLRKIACNNIRNRKFDGEIVSKCAKRIECMDKLGIIEMNNTDVSLDAIITFYQVLASTRQVNSNPNLIFEFYGSLASRQFLDRLGFQSIILKFESALSGQEKSITMVSSLTKTIQKKLQTYINETGDSIQKLHEDGLYNLLKQYEQHGSELLVNMPIRTNQELGKLWTLPINCAIMGKDENMVKLLIKRGARIDSWDHRCKTPLAEACDINDISLVKYLLNEGADPGSIDFSAPSCLEIAIKHNNLRMCELLLQGGAPLNLNCNAIKGYKSPLYLACKSASSEIISLLLNLGADPNWRGPNKLTPAVLAYQRDSAWTKTFLDAGAGRPHDRRWVLTEVLSHAIMKNDITAVKLLVTKYNGLLKRTHHMWSMPHIQASRLGRIEILDYLIATGADINGSGPDGLTALYVAAEEGQTKAVQLLLEHGAEIEKSNKDGQTPLHVACLENRSEVAKQLLKAGASISITDDIYGETPLMICIRTRHEEMAKTLIKEAKLLDCDAADAHGRTSLMYAIFFGLFGVADMLTERGADINITDDCGNSPYSIACERILLPGAEKKNLKKYIKMRKSKSGTTKSGTNNWMDRYRDSQTAIKMAASGPVVLSEQDDISSVEKDQGGASSDFGPRTHQRSMNRPSRKSHSYGRLARFALQLTKSLKAW